MCSIDVTFKWLLWVFLHFWVGKACFYSTHILKSILSNWLLLHSLYTEDFLHFQDSSSHTQKKYLFWNGSIPKNQWASHAAVSYQWRIWHVYSGTIHLIHTAAKQNCKCSIDFKQTVPHTCAHARGSSLKPPSRCLTRHLVTARN